MELRLAIRLTDKTSCGYDFGCLIERMLDQAQDQSQSGAYDRRAGD